MAPRSFIGSLPVVPLADLNAQEQDCSICLSAYTASNATEEPRRLPCTHVFGNDCLTLWLEDHNTCPLCRAVLFPQERRVPPMPNAFNESVFRGLDTEGLVFIMREFLNRQPPRDREFRTAPNWPEGTMLLERITPGVRATVFARPQESQRESTDREIPLFARPQVNQRESTNREAPHSAQGSMENDSPSARYALPLPNQRPVQPQEPLGNTHHLYGGELLYDGSYSIWVGLPAEPGTNRASRVFRTNFISVEAAARQRDALRALYAAQRGLDRGRRVREIISGANERIHGDRSGTAIPEQIVRNVLTRTGASGANSSGGHQSTGASGASIFARPQTSSEANRFGPRITNVPITTLPYQTLYGGVTAVIVNPEHSEHPAWPPRPSVGTIGRTSIYPSQPTQHVLLSARPMTHREAMNLATNRMQQTEITSAELLRSREMPSVGPFTPLSPFYPNTQLPLPTSLGTRIRPAPPETYRGPLERSRENYTQAIPRPPLQPRRFANTPPLGASSAEWSAYLGGQRTGALQNPLSNFQGANTRADDGTRANAEGFNSRSTSYMHRQGTYAEPSTREQHSQAPNNGHDHNEAPSMGPTSYPHPRQILGRPPNRLGGNLLPMPRDRSEGAGRIPQLHQETRVEPGLRRHLREVTGRDDVDPRGGVTRDFMGHSTLRRGHDSRFM